MKSKAKFAGHPIHPMLIVFPLGLLVSSVVFDIVSKLSGNNVFATVAFWSIAGGIIGGLVAALFGFWDWLTIPAGTRAKIIGAWHGGSNVIVVVLFAISWILRWNDPEHLSGVVPFILEIVAIVLGAIAGWMGGELVFRLGVGVDSDANLDAPNSLSSSMDEDAR